MKQLSRPNRHIIVGIGCRRGTAAATIISSVREGLAMAGYGLDDVRCLASADVKADEAGLLEGLRTRRGLTFIMVSHDLAVVTHLCQRLMVMQRGQTVELLSSGDLTANRVKDPYTQKLMQASGGFRRTLAVKQK